MAIIRIAWAEGYNRDIHVLAGQATRTLNDALFVYDSANPGGVRATTYLPAHPTVSLTFNALFKGAPSAIGMHLNPASGQVRVDAALPPLRKNNFIIEVTVVDSADHSSAAETIRVHVHKSVDQVALTPAAMTIRPGTIPLAKSEQTSYRFAVRATFDDHTMGDLTVGHGVIWSAAGTDVKFDDYGHIILDTSSAVGHTTVITATLPAALGSSSATGTIVIEKPWSAEPAMPKTSIVPGGGWPGTTLPEKAPNILILGDGFGGTKADADAFETIAATMVHFIKTDKVVRPFDLLCTSMNFWRVMVPSVQRGISVRCEVYLVDAGYVCPVPRAVKPPASGEWNLENLVYAVGLPVPPDMAKSADDLRGDWAVLVPADRLPPAGAVDDDLITMWKTLGKRGFIDEIDAFPAMSYGAPPAANLNTFTPMLDLHQDRAGRDGLTPFFAVLESDNGVQVGIENIGSVWAAHGALPFDNTDLIVMMSSHPGGRAANYDGYIALSTKGGTFQIKAAPVAGASNFTLDFTEPPMDVSPDTSRTFTHEIGHSFGLGDEHVDFDADYPFTTADLASFANLQRLDDVVDAAKQIDGKLIRWNWLRVRKAAEITGPAVTSTVPNCFDIPVVLGQGLQFQADDMVLLRLRKPGTVIDFPAKVVELQHALRVVDKRADVVVVTAAAGSPVTLADLQAFAAGSMVFVPVPMPKGMPGPTDPYARMVAKNVENLITTTHAPLYRRPTGADLTDEIKRNKEIQHPDLDGLAPGLSSNSFCREVTPSIVGLYGGGARYARKIFHPAGAMCMMRNNHENGAPFCPVCRYIMVEMIDPFKHFTIDQDYDDIYPLR